MPNVLIRDVPSEDLDELKVAATERGSSLQNLLLETVAAQASQLRRRSAVVRAEQRLHGGRPVPEDERAAVLDAVRAEHGERAARMADAAAR